MNRILITGATGNVGKAIIDLLPETDIHNTFYAGVRNIVKDTKILPTDSVYPIHFDFLDSNTYQKALTQCDTLFLLRPPQLADVNIVFKPLIEMAKTCKVSHIVFLSVQGVEKSKIIPHHKIEKLIVDSGISYTFLRPAYFMQNFTTTLLDDIVNRHRIFLPAGNAQFTLIDIDDIAKVAVKVLLNPAHYHHQALVLTNEEQLNFKQMATIISECIGRKITYTSPNLLWFYWEKKKKKMPTMLILVMIMLHYFPRFQSSPLVTTTVKEITGKAPNTFAQFISNHKSILRIK
jgi:uncharacterized protein YbjT (DUF2867 family)